MTYLPRSDFTTDDKARKNDMTGPAAIRKLLSLMTFAAAVSACISVTIAPAQERNPDYSAIIAAPDRTEADLQTDKRRDPVKLLALLIHPNYRNKRRM